MNFLNPAVLFAAIAALVPLIIHLFSRRKVKIVEFSSLKHLKAMQKRQVRRLKIRQLLLLILRMLIILMVVLAFARPTTEGGNFGSHASVSAVIVFDNSASMNRYVNDGNLFDIALKKAEEILSTFGEADEVCLVALDAAGNDDKVLEFTSASTALEKLQRIKTGCAPGRLAENIARAGELLDGAVNANKEIYVICDRQRNLLPEEAILQDFKHHVYYVDLPFADFSNVGIKQVKLGGQMLLPGRDFDIAATINNYSRSDQNDLIASLYIDNNRVAQSGFDIKSRQETQVRFKWSVPQGGFHSGYVEISDDRLNADNRRYFTFYIPEKFSILIVNDDLSAGFIRMALTPSETTNQYWSIHEVKPDDLAGINLWDYDIYILAGAPALSDVHLKRLRNYVFNGKTMFVTYSHKTDIDYFNRYWTNNTGVIYDEAVPQVVSTAGYYTLAEVDNNHPVFSVFNFNKMEMPEIKFYALPKLHTEQDIRILARFSGDRPAIVEKKIGQGKVLTFTGPLTPQYSTLTGDAFFVPMTARIMEYLASALSQYDLDLICGDGVTRSISLGNPLTDILEMVTPDSSTHALKPEEDNGHIILKPAPVNQSGIYHVNYQRREIDRFSLNMVTSESDLEAVDVDELAVMLGSENYRTLGNDTQVAQIIGEFRFGRELWQVFIWLAAVLLLLEMVLARSYANKEEE